jgi:hypothetical protein
MTATTSSTTGGRYNVAHYLEKQYLLGAINCIAALSIFFFGYDQGMMVSLIPWFLI